MYEFVDTTPQGSAKGTSLSIQTIFNGINLDETLSDDQGSFITLSVTGRSNTSNRISTIQVAGMDGVHEHEKTSIEPRQPIVSFKLKDKTNEGFRERLNRLNALLEGSKKLLEFTDENLFYYATVSTIDIPEETGNDLVGTITFFCSDPYKYGFERNAAFPSDAIFLDNRGSTKTYPIIEMQALEPVTFAMIQNQNNEYMMVGQPVDEDGNEVVIDERVSVLYENGSTIDTWTTANLNMIDQEFNDISGSMGSDGAGIRANNYGTGDKTHGPAVFKELPTAIQDFEIETTFDIISRRTEENWRAEIYFQDENLNTLGKLGVKDNVRAYKRRYGLGRVGHYRSGGPRNGYAIGQHNYKYDDSRDVTLMYLRVKREGQRYTFYIAQWLNGRHTRTVTSSLNDTNNDFQGRLKYITLFLGKYKDRPNPTRLRINSVEVFELNQITEDQTPYIAYPDDVITFDHRIGEVYINGENRKDLKNFGASYFPLYQGRNELIVLPENSFSTILRYQERYK